MQFIAWVIAAYLAICAVVYFGNRIFIYFPDQARISPVEAGLDGVKEIEIAAADGTNLVAWYKDLKATSRQAREKALGLSNLEI